MMPRPHPETSWANRIARLDELEAIRLQRRLTPQESAEFDRTDELVFNKRRRLRAEIARAEQRLARLLDLDRVLA